MFANEHTNHPQARRYRIMVRAIVKKAQTESNQLRIAKAEDKRERKAEKRARDAHRTELGKLVAVERLTDGLPR